MQTCLSTDLQTYIPVLLTAVTASTLSKHGESETQSEIMHKGTS